ncbi:SRPBCC family protein [Actinokineospora bangkokensis]|uniref:ATPase n=1 Tax=Actinokineospora bangkokensis TaxID=1193682 RepID=A0A1Q9LCU9_9PSEU|nr:SRPBCC family protein [Actinokineospora bangkokensis]OLR89839.1 ATPase [Actinokineospora bangkokensis]
MAMATKGTAVVTTPGDTTILITREFDAPKHLVYRAWTEPELIARWWAGDMGTVTSVEVDLRVGGTWRYAMVAEGGFEVAFHGEYRELVPDERIVSTEVYEGAPEGFAVNTLTLTEADGRTTLTVLVEHQNQEHRDMHINSGMEHGMQTSMNHLEEVAISLR